MKESVEDETFCCTFMAIINYLINSIGKNDLTLRDIVALLATDILSSQPVLATEHLSAIKI